MRKILRVLGLPLLGLFSLYPALGQDIKEVRRAVPLSPDGQVVIQTFKGSVSVTAWDNPTVDIYARIEPDGTSSEERAMVPDTEVRIEPSDRSVRIESDYRKVQERRSGLFGFNGSLPLIHYTIQMPRTATLDIKDHKSKISVAGLRSSVALRTHKGSADISQLDGALKVNTHKGDIRVQFARLSGESSIETFKGDIDIAMPRNQGFDLDSNLGRRGQLNSDFAVTATIRKWGRNEKAYQGPVNGGGPRMHLKTHKGSFRLRQA